MNRFKLAEPVTDKVAAALADYPPLIRQLLANREITEAVAATAWLQPQYEEVLHDPFMMPGMEIGIDRIKKALNTKERIAIFSDYDCDGIPGAVVLNDFFTALGYTNVTTYIPHRHFEGFGLNEAAVEKLAADGVHLIITIDCGSTDVAPVARANELGIDVIITDHHQSGTELPAAWAIINPTLNTDYPFPYLCGAGVIFKVIQALLQSLDHSIPPGREKWWLDMVGLATIADMVPLTGENRTLAHYGLRVLRQSRRPGLQQLLKKQRASQQHLTEDDIGFTIGPRINAASRMGAPHEALTLLLTTDEGIARAQVDQLELLNNERKGQVAAMTRAAHKKIAAFSTIPSVLVLGDPDWRPSLVGLVANKLAEEHQVPAFIWGRDGNGVLKGSCRSEGVTSVVRLMEALPEAFIESGGHHFSGGFSVAETAIHTLAAELITAREKLGEAATVVTPQTIDALLTLEDVDTSLLKALAQLGPYGVGNPKPLFRFSGVVPQTVAVFGKTKEHTKVTFTTDGLAKEAIAFFTLPESFTRRPVTTEACDVIAHIEQSFFMGRLQTRLRIVDIE